MLKPIKVGDGKTRKGSKSYPKRETGPTKLVRVDSKTQLELPADYTPEQVAAAIAAYKERHS